MELGVLGHQRCEKEERIIATQGPQENSVTPASSVVSTQPYTLDLHLAGEDFPGGPMLGIHLPMVGMQVVF